MDLELKGKRVLITGGSRGIGRAMVLAFARQGADVVTCYRQEGPAVESLRAELTELGVTHELVRADVGVAEDVERLLRTVEESLGGLDVVVNNAGAQGRAPLLSMDLDEWQRVVGSNLTGAYLVLKAAVPLLSDGGSIINVGSAAALRGIGGSSHYIASKAGVLGLTRSLAQELGGRWIRVNTLSPGGTETEEAANIPKEAKERFLSMVPLKRMAKPEDIANAALFLASDLSSFISGHTLNVDGGI